jgi:hypothetical protein
MRFAIVLLLFDVLTNADVIRLVKAGLSPATIEAKIAASETKFDTTTDGLVALAEADVPDPVIRAMIEHSITPPVPPVPPVPPAPAAPPAPPAPGARRYEVAIHRDAHAKCDGAELRVDGRGVKAAGCKELDFALGWDEVGSLCYDYGFRGTIVLTAGERQHRISTTTPAAAKRIVERIGVVRPGLVRSECVRP